MFKKIIIAGIVLYGVSLTIDIAPAFWTFPLIHNASKVSAEEEANADITPKEVTPVGITVDTTFDRSSLPKDTYAIPEVIHKNGLNIIFISDKYESKEAFDISVEFLKGALKTVEPWKSYDDLNFFAVYTKKDDFCHVEKENHRKPTLRCTIDINNYILPLRLYRFKAVVVSREDFTSWANLARINNTMLAYSLPAATEGQPLLRKIFLHELTHGFGLRDEMTKSVIALAGSEATKAGGPNCAPDLKTALKWWGDLVPRGDNGEYIFDGEANTVGFYYGCAGNETYIKPTVGSLLNLQDFTHPSEDYGPVSERYLKKMLKYCYSDQVYSTKVDPDFFETYPEFKICTKN